MTTTDVRWRASFSASCLHAADAVRRKRPLVDPALDEALSEPVAQLVGELIACDLAGDAVWSHLLPLSAAIDNNRELVDVAITKTLGRQSAPPVRERLAGRIAELEAALRGVLPQVVEDLALRAGPIREQWEARGPGLLWGVARLTETQLLPPAAEVVLVQPVLGGGGEAYPLYNLALLEAVLTNPTPAVPEVVRLGWLVAQLNLDLPEYQGELRRELTLKLGAWALAPVVLAAAADVELCSADERTLATALDLWRVDPAGQKDAKQLAAVLTNWWDTYAASRPAWPIALAALDRMLG